MEDDVAANVAFDQQLDFRKRRLVKRHRQGRLSLAAEGIGVEAGKDRTDLTWSDFLGFDDRSGAAATGAHRTDPHSLRAAVFEGESMFGLGSLGHRSEIVSRCREQSARPLLRLQASNARQCQNSGPNDPTHDPVTPKSAEVQKVGSRSDPLNAIDRPHVRKKDRSQPAE
jgi:hypothetical protein